MKKKKLKSISKLKKETDSVFSVWIRQRGMDDRGYNTCFTCKKKKFWKELQCGHYISRSFLSLRYDPRNCHPQDIACNLFKKGNLDVYAIELIKEYGTGILEELNKEKYIFEKFDRKRYNEIINEYKFK